MRYQNDKSKWIILALVLVILVLLGIIAYYFWLNPTYQKFILTKQQEAYNLGAIDNQRAILTGLRNNLIQFGFVQITFEDNQVVYLVPVDPKQINQQPSTPEGNLSS